MNGNSIRSGGPAPRQRILIIDDEPVVGLSATRILAIDGHQVDTRENPQEGLQAALSGEYDVIFLDMVMPGLDGLEILRRLKSAGVASEVVIITGYSTVQSAVQAMRLGAADYLPKPFSPEELRMVFHKVLERSALIRENQALRLELRSREGFAGIVGESRAMERVYATLRRVAPTQGTVLIIGESGTGKELLARAIHELSPRRERMFVACDCSALAPTLLESELFGHLKGSFTGAVAAKSGLFEVADGGTLFLDEVSNISQETQGKLLRVLETRKVKRVGDTAEREVDIRLIAATNRDLQAMVKERAFREDLYYRLNVVPLTLPPLRERQGDIPHLALHFLERFRANNPVRVQGFSPEAMRQLECYTWPGNVRELKNLVERMAILCDGERIEVSHLPPELREAQPRCDLSDLPRKWDDFKEFKRKVREAAINDMERRFLQDALLRNDWNVTRAAEEVGMLRPNFHALMRKHGLSYEEDGEGD